MRLVQVPHGGGQHDDIAGALKRLEQELLGHDGVSILEFGLLIVALSIRLYGTNARILPRIINSGRRPVT
jgi:hypothetical protein